MSDTFDDFELDEPVRGGRTGMKIFLIGCASLFGLVLVLLMVLGFMVTSGYFPDTMVQTGEEMGGPVREQLEEAQILTDQDEVLLFYSYAMWNAADGGSAITTDGLVTWIVLDGELSIDRVPYAAIQGVRINQPGSFISDSLLEVETEHCYYFPVISVEDNGDETFRDRLISEWNARGGHRPEDVPAAFTESEMRILDLDGTGADGQIEDEPDSGGTPEDAEVGDG
tara:strand:+ start:1216 stop:1893 length:678 start_codon:yes stop_codon:yes gene_type:complete